MISWFKSLFEEKPKPVPRDTPVDKFHLEYKGAYYGPEVSADLDRNRVSHYFKMTRNYGAWQIQVRQAQTLYHNLYYKVQLCETDKGSEFFTVNHLEELPVHIFTAIKDSYSLYLSKLKEKEEEKARISDLRQTEFAQFLQNRESSK